MRVLLVHPNFPAQFRHIATALGGYEQNRVVFLTSNPRKEWNIPGVAKAVFGTRRTTHPETHPLAGPWEQAVIQAEAALAGARKLRDEHDFTPDVIVGHSGWGPTMYLKDLFPDTPLLSYFEWFYKPGGADALFGRPESPDAGVIPMLHTRNGPVLTDLANCDFGYSPTHWQKAQFPAFAREKIAVRHDGVDTEYFTPSPGARLVLPGLDLSLHSELVTFAARGMEPYRGFPQFMAAVPAILEERPECRIVIAGEDRCCYGPPPEPGKTWKDAAMEKLIASGADTGRVHFTGSLPYGRYRQLLRASSVHVYLTRPFILSWSLLEAMSCGCLVVASDTEPVREVIEHERNGLMTDFFASDAIAQAVCDALQRGEDLAPLRTAARETVARRYDLRMLLPGHLRMIANLGRGRRPLEGVDGQADEAPSEKAPQAPRFGPA